MKCYKGIYGYWDLEKNQVAYVGKDSNMSKKERHYAHKAPSKYDVQPFNRVLQNNPDRYEYYEICNLPMSASDDELNHYEKLYIKTLKPVHNYDAGGDGSTGYKHTDEAKAKISKANKGKRCGKNHPRYGKHHTAEAKRKLSEARKGKKMDEETKRKISESLKGENNPNYGKTFSDESKRKMSEAKKGMYDGENHPQYRHDLDNKVLYETYLKVNSYRKVASMFNTNKTTIMRRVKKYAAENNLPL